MEKKTINHELGHASLVRSSYVGGYTQMVLPTTMDKRVAAVLLDMPLETTPSDYCSTILETKFTEDNPQN